MRTSACGQVNHGSRFESGRDSSSKPSLKTGAEMVSTGTNDQTQRAVVDREATKIRDHKSTADNVLQFRAPARALAA